MFFSEIHISARRPNRREVISHRWTTGNTLLFETRSNWGFPKTISLKVSRLSKSNDGREEANLADDKGTTQGLTEIGCGFVDLCPIWEQISEEIESLPAFDSETKIFLFENAEEFDQHGELDKKTMAKEDVRIFVNGIFFSQYSMLTYHIHEFSRG